MSAKNPSLPEQVDASALADAEAKVCQTIEAARRTCAQGRAGLGQLQDALAPITQATEAVAQVARQLSEMVLKAATEITRSGPAGQLFLPLVEQLADAARASLTAAHELRRSSADGGNRARDLIALAERTHTALNQLAPAISTLKSATAEAARRRGPGVEVIVRTDSFSTDKASRVAELTEQALQQGNQRPSRPKN